ncbi:hypothetical protein [Candidatus Contubernalis alkaliaceticus]|uniref:hypothetical protein n=1 Tax=Candidatus Contubernalis alkaliaceticus TaxID=338645 RepID=UPI001F4C3859|nr:hypothetical protein [Candidatus Contubernalis alkalaceticus]UNC93648.1 hypothetical protein HUE98_17105 [Candidatus Contubernalis alkalaceticus]
MTELAQTRKLSAQDVLTNGDNHHCILGLSRGEAFLYDIFSGDPGTVPMAPLICQFSL